MIAAVAFAVVGASAAPAMAATTPPAASAAAARPNVLSESASGAVSPHVRLGTACNFVVEEVKHDAINANVTCNSLVASIFFTVFGEDRYGNLPWESIKTCNLTTACGDLWKGSSSDVTQTACVEVTFLTGTPRILGNCLTVKV